MYYIYYCNRKIDDLSYDIKINISEKDKLIKKYSLQNTGEYKEYWENNVCIRSSNQGIVSSHYIEDIHYEYILLSEKNFLIHEFKETPCQIYNFYQVDQEETYQKYKIEKGAIIIELREYQDYLTLTFICTCINDFYQQTIF
tara:strand:+ start:1429 stop:1854 length:426 start_codon:yes stop_codon:yes gene_type:complete